MHNLGLLVTVITKTFSKLIVNGSPTCLFTLFMLYCLFILKWNTRENGFNLVLFSVWILGPVSRKP